MNQPEENMTPNQRRWSLSRDEFAEAVSALGYPVEFADLLAKQLGSPKAIDRGEGSMLYEVSAEQFEAVNVMIENRMINGENTLRVVKGPEKRMRFDENTYARLKDLTFHNGVIEVKMLSRLLPDAPDFARGFIGIAFRISPDDSEFESFYIRPTNAMTDDPVRRAHGCQYFSYPGYTFAYFREYDIDGYEAPMNCGLDEWVRLKAVIHNETAAFYLNDSEDPVLTVSGMKHGPNAQGSVGFFVDIGTEAFFKDLVITQDESKRGQTDIRCFLSSPEE